MYIFSKLSSFFLLKSLRERRERERERERSKKQKTRQTFFEPEIKRKSNILYATTSST